MPAHLNLAPTALPTAQQSDPALLGWMVGSPPPADRIIRFDDGSANRFPQLRWSLSNQRQLVPTRVVGRGFEPVCALPRADRDDIDSLQFTPLGTDQTMRWDQSLAANYTDGIVVLHQGQIVYERYFGVLRPDVPHLAMSISKSVVGLLGAMLVDDGRLDAQALVARYVPELQASAFGDATVQQLLDMTTGLQYSEDYADPQADIWAHVRAGGVLPRLAGRNDHGGPSSFYASLQSVRKQGAHGQAFAYKTVNSDALGWVLRRITGSSLVDAVSQRLWQQLGAEHEACYSVDSTGTEFAGGGLNTCLRDLARLGEMMRLGGWFNGRQIVAEAVVDGLRRGGDRAQFAQGGYPLLAGWSYRNMWWVSHNPHGAYMARGVHGQCVYIDPAADMVVARYASHPVARNAANDPTSLPAWQALAEHLLRN